MEMKSRWRITVSLVIVALLATVGLGWARESATEAAPAPASIATTFRGYVRLCPSTTTGIRGVTVALKKKVDSSWTQVASTTTDSNGAFTLTYSGSVYANYFRIVETDPAGYTSCNAVPGSGGSKIDNNTIEYFVYDAGGTYSGNIFYDQPINKAPRVQSITPYNNCSNVGQRQSFTITATDQDGAGNITILDFEIDDSCGWPFNNAIHLSLQPLSQRLYLKNDDGETAQDYIFPGAGQWGSGQMENSQCIVHLDGCRYTSSGQTVTLVVAIEFKASYVGTRQLCGRVKDAANAEHSLNPGTWRVRSGVTATVTRTFTPTGTRTPTRTATPTATPTAMRGQITAIVYHDVNGNGVQDPAEPPISGVRVDLYYSAGGHVAMCYTGEDGRCVFSNLATTIYRVVETDPEGYESTTPNEVIVDLTSIPFGTASFGDRRASNPQIEITMTAHRVREVGPSLADAAYISDTIQVVISVTNVGGVPLNPVNANVTYNTGCWDYVGSLYNPLDPADDGQLDWSWTLFGVGPNPPNPALNPGEVMVFWVRFHAVANCAQTQICAHGVGLDAELGTSSPPAHACITWDLTPPKLEVALRVVGVHRGGFILSPDKDTLMSEPAALLLPDETVAISDIIELGIVVTNPGQVAITQLSVMLEVPAPCFHAPFANPPVDWEMVCAPMPCVFELHWNDVTVALGDLAPGGSLTVRVWLHARELCQDARVCAAAWGWSAQGAFVPEAGDCELFDVTLAVWASVWHDLFQPYGTWPAAWEPPLAGATLQLRDAGTNALIDQCVTDGFGTCPLRGVLSGVNYTIREINPPGFDIDTTPNQVPYSYDPFVFAIIYFGDRRSPRLEVEIGPPTEVCISDTVTIAITITNRGDLPIESAPMTLTYNVNCFRYLGHSTVPSDDNVNDGQINWTDIFPGLGGPPPDWPVVLTATFHAEGVCAPARVCVAVSGRDSGANAVPLAEDCVEISVYAPDPGPCRDILLDGSFEAGRGNWMTAEGVVVGCPPAPLIELSGNNPHSGAVALRFGSPNGCPSFAQAWRTIALPSNTATATLSFWYRMNDPVPDPVNPIFPPPPPPDFLAAALGQEIAPGVFILAQDLLAPRAGTVGWTRVEADVSQFAGSTIGVVFFFRQNGQIDQPEAFVDDVELCIVECGPPRPDPGTPGQPGGPGVPICWKAGSFPDYAPSGVPDFDQRQSTWQNAQNAWIYDGPVALLNSLWWFDSRFEPGSTPPPTISDGYPLMPAGTWDDHDARGVPTFVQDLAYRADTNGQRSGQVHQGTNIHDLRDAARSYIQDRGLLEQYSITLQQSPDFDWVRTEISRCEDVVLLLGFWEHQLTGWRRLGGHYVTSAGVGCHDDYIAISDPFFNRAEAGRPGRALPTGPHTHPAAPPDTVHNDAQYVSHDVYRVVPVNSPGAFWGLQGYADDFADDLWNFFGLNFTADQEASRASSYEGGAVVVAVEYALAVSPLPPGVSIHVTPHLRTMAVGEVFSVTLTVNASAGNVDRAFASLGFNPTYLTVVDQNGNPTNRIVPGPAFTTIPTNTVNNTTGYIDFATAQRATPLHEDFVLATIRFKAKAQTTGAGTPVQFLQQPGHVTNLLHGALSVMTGSTDGQVMIQGSPATLNGSVTLQGRPTAPHDSWIGPLDVTLHQPGSTQALFTYAVQTDNRGRFTITGITAGTYDIRVKGPHTLANLRSSVALNAGSNSVNMGTLLEGDASNDNQVNIADASILASAFGFGKTNPSYKPEADFNNDGVINNADQQLLQANFGKSGNQAVTTAWVHGLADRLLSGAIRTMTTQNGVTLLLQPADSTVNRDQVLKMDVLIRAGSQRVDSAEVHIPFDRARLEVVNAQGNPVTQITPGTALPSVLLNRVNSSQGLISFAAMNTTANPPSGDIPLASFYVKAKAPAPTGTYLLFTFQTGWMTDGMYREQSVLGQVQAAKIVIGGQYTIRLPVILKNQRR